MSRKRDDITVEMVVEEYKKIPNMLVAAEKLGCSETMVRNHLRKAGIDTSRKTEYTRKLKRPDTKRIIFKNKREQAHYICTELREPLTDFLIEIIEKMRNEKNANL